MLEFEPLCLSAQSVISLSLKTMLNHVGFRLLLLNSARLLSEKSFGNMAFLNPEVVGGIADWLPHFLFGGYSGGLLETRVHGHGRARSLSSLFPTI
jgi:hypothetical protein